MTRLETCWNFALFGGGKSQAALYAQVAAGYGFRIQHFESMHDLDYLGRFREFDAAIVHEDLQPLSGLELAEYLEKLFQSLPMILLTKPDVDGAAYLSVLPKSIIDCLPATQSPEDVLDRMLAVVELRQPLYLAAVKPSHF